MSGSFTARIHLALAMVIVGSSVAAGKIMAAAMPIFLASALRFALALLLLVPILRLKEGGLPRLSARSWGILALQSLFGSFLFTVFLLYGLRLTTSSAAGVITSATPACIGLIAWIFLRERPGRAEACGILLSVAGVMLVNAAGGSGEPGEPGEPGATLSPLLGNLLVMGAVVFESLFLLLRKAVPERISPLGVSTVISFFGLLWFLPMAAYEAAGTDFALVGAAGWLSTIYYGVVVTVLAYLFWFSGITKVSAATAGVMTGVMPVSALVLSALVLGERLTPAHIAGCACVLAGIALISGVTGFARKREA